MLELEARRAKSAKVSNEEMPDRVRRIRSYVIKEPDGRMGHFAFTRRRMLNRSASMPGAPARLVTTSSMS